MTKTCKKHGKLSSDQIYTQKSDGFKRCRICIHEASAKYIRHGKLNTSIGLAKQDLASREFFAMTNQFRDFSSFNHDGNIFYVDCEKFIAHNKSTYMQQVG